MNHDSQIYTQSHTKRKGFVSPTVPPKQWWWVKPEASASHDPLPESPMSGTDVHVNQFM